MKKIGAFILIAATLVLMSGCGGGGNKSDIVGFWEITDENSAAAYGLGLEFRKDGTMYIGLSKENLAEFTDMSEKEIEQALEGLGYLYKITYDIKSDTSMEITVSAMMGLAKEKTEVAYSLDGDTLVLDGVTYKRVE
jgi:hypothetical protein